MFHSEKVSSVWGKLESFSLEQMLAFQQQHSKTQSPQSKQVWVMFSFAWLYNIQHGVEESILTTAVCEGTSREDGLFWTFLFQLKITGIGQWSSYQKEWFQNAPYPKFSPEIWSFKLFVSAFKVALVFNDFAIVSFSDASKFSLAFFSYDFLPMHI